MSYRQRAAKTNINSLGNQEGYIMKPVIAIVGRPNVGKSTLFNRIIGRRQAITLNISGVTRDRHYGQADWEGREFTCIDTGGLLFEGSDLADKIRQQIDVAIQEADFVLFLTDGQSGLLPEEMQWAQTLRKGSKKVIYVVNKIDGPHHEDRITEFYRLGTDTLFSISAEHGYRVNDLLDALVQMFPSKSVDSQLKKETLRVALVGRPNVGKSSLFNQLIGEERAVVHDEPGTTRDVVNTVIDWPGQSYTFLDTAGIRRKTQKSSLVERYSIFKTLRAVEQSDIAMLILEAQTGLQKQDAHLCSYICENYRGVVIVWNKWDLVNNGEGSVREMEKYAARTLRAFPFASFAPILFLSAKTGWGVQDVWKVLPMLFRQMKTKIATSKINEALEQVVALREPPIYRQYPIRFYYGTQTGTCPPTFTIFANYPQGLHPAYHRFMVKTLRESLGLHESPLKLKFQARKRRK